MEAAQDAERIAPAVARRPITGNPAIARGVWKVDVKIAAGGERGAHIVAPSALAFDRA